MFAGGETLDDVHLIQLTEVIGPLPEQIFLAWGHGSFYFDAGSSKRIYNPEGDESLDDDSCPDSEVSKSDDGHSELDDGESAFSEEDDAVTSDSEDRLARVRLSEPLEAMFRQKKPEDVDEV